MSVVDAASLVETRRIRVGNGPQSILIDRAGRRAYVFNTLSNTVSVLDLGTLEVVATVATEAGPVRGEFNRAGNRLYVLHRVLPISQRVSTRRRFPSCAGCTWEPEGRR